MTACTCCRVKSDGGLYFPTKSLGTRVGRAWLLIAFGLIPSTSRINYPGKKNKQCVCVRSVSRKSRDPDALRSREVMVVMK